MRTRSHIYLASLQWDGLWIIQQPVCREISRRESVLFVERFVSFFTVLRYPRLWKRLFAWLRGARQLGPNLRVLAPLPLWHLGHRVPWLFRMEFAIQRWWIFLWAGGNAHDNRILWVDNPLYECGVGRLGERLSVYHLADEIAAFPTSHAITIERLEQQLLEKVDVCFAAAEQLGRGKRHHHARVFTIWNAVDGGVFESTREMEDSFQSVAELSGPKVAFVGVLDEWVDVDLLAAVAERLPKVHFLVIGPSNIDDRLLYQRPNVHRFGRRDRADIPHLLRRCSASLVPFKKTRLTERILPLKVFEALAAGATPVCTAFSPDLQELAREGLVLLGDSPEDFASVVELAIAKDEPLHRARLERYGRAQTWEARWAQMSSILDSVLDEAGQAGPGLRASQSPSDNSIIKHEDRN